MDKTEFKEFDTASLEFARLIYKNKKKLSLKNNISPTLTTNCEIVVAVKGENMEKNLRIRKLTPLECYRLMGFSDKDFYKSQSVPTSNAQLYKQAGNSIVVDVLEELLCMMLDENDNLLV